LEYLAKDFHLESMFGIDFILQEERIWVLEVNPRYPASLEVLELAGMTASPVVAKAIYFAPHPLRYPASGPWDADLAVPFDPWHVPDFADIPEPGELIEAGSPVLTFFASGSNPDDCRERLQSRAGELDILFRNAT
jgi:predicted ATP-grasp superfamily ATP-dependent carboligase